MNQLQLDAKLNIKKHELWLFQTKDRATQVVVVSLKMPIQLLTRLFAQKSKVSLTDCWG